MTSPDPARDRGLPRWAAHRETLLAVARGAVETGVREGREPDVDAGRFAPALCDLRATFVTLRIGGALRGCTGTLEAVEALVADVALRAWASALRDPRFTPVEERELEALDYHISILEPPRPLPARSEAELLEALRPGVDGLILSQGRARSTFLPAVWQSLPSPRDFLRELKRKAGLPPDYWSDALRFERYAVDEIS